MDKSKVSITPTEHGLTFTLPIKTQSPKRMAIIRNMVADGAFDDLLAYARSLTSKRRTFYGSVPRFRAYGQDKLADKARGSVLSMFDRMLQTTRSHAPYSKATSHIGVEIECFVPIANLGTACQYRDCDYCDGAGTREDSDLNDVTCDECNGEGRLMRTASYGQAREAIAKLFREAKVTYSTIKEDGSIRPDSGHVAVEITVLTRLDRPENLSRACTILKSLGAKVNKSCGLHVHLDARHLDVRQVKKVGRNFKNAMPILASMVPSSRRTNTFCALAVSGLKGGRYFAVNLTAYRKFKTVEIRLHSGTTDFRKIIEWSTLLTGIFNAKKLTQPVSTLNELTDFVTIPEHTLEYCAQRAALFSPEAVCADGYQDQDSTEPRELTPQDLGSMTATEARQTVIEEVVAPSNEQMTIAQMRERFFYGTGAATAQPSMISWTTTTAWDMPVITPIVSDDEAV